MSNTVQASHEAEATGSYTSPLSRQNEPSTGLVKERFAILSPDGAEIALWRIATCRRKESATRQPAILYAHGGAFIYRNLNMEEVRLDKFNDSLIGRLGPKPLFDSGCVLLYVSYRIADEAPFPKPVEDVCAAYGFARTNADALGILEDKICIAGVSAGAHLALGATMMAVDHGLAPPCGQVLLYPMLDPEARPGVRDDLAVGWERFLSHLDKVPVEQQKYARLLDLPPEHLARLPPTYMDVGDRDPFHQEVSRAISKFQACIPHVTHRVWEGRGHNFESGLYQAEERRLELQPVWALREAFFGEIFSSSDSTGSDSFPFI